ncbi:hypothetical protein Godav_027455, partial [Gossypium davidsonii]|nr:hypothetical protein [Gossypium davidsonii]
GDGGGETRNVVSPFAETLLAGGSLLKGLARKSWRIKWGLWGFRPSLEEELSCREARWEEVESGEDDDDDEEEEEEEEEDDTEDSVFRLNGSNGNKSNEDRNTKKVRFKDLETKTNNNMVVDLSPALMVSWKDKALGRGSSIFGCEEDFEFLEGDITMNTINGVPVISFFREDPEDPSKGHGDHDGGEIVRSKFSVLTPSQSDLQSLEAFTLFPSYGH